MITNLKAPAGSLENGTFYFPIRIYYEDTDAGGIVYNANYLKFAERARTEFLRHIGADAQQSTLENEGLTFVVRHLDIDFIMPAKLDDFIVATCTIKEQKNASLLIYQEIKRHDDVLAKLNVQIACLDMKRGRPVRIPEDISQKFAQTITL